MNIKKILFVLIFCLGAQAGFIFAGEGEEQKAQPSQGLWSYVEAAKRKAAQAAAAVGIRTPSEAWRVTKKATETVTPFEKGVHAAIAAGTGGIIGSLDRSMADALVSKVKPWVIPAFIFGFGLQKIFAHYHNKDITRQAAVDEVKSLISLQLADHLTYPTRSTKLHALLKKNEFLVDLGDVDGIVAQACSELSKQIAAIKPNETDKLIDQEISNLRTYFVQTGMHNVLDQSSYMENNQNIKNLKNTLQNAKALAAWSVYNRLLKQKPVNSKYTYSFGKTSSAKFYPQMTRKEGNAFEQRKTAWEEGMKKVREKTRVHQDLDELLGSEEK